MRRRIFKKTDLIGNISQELVHRSPDYLVDRAASRTIPQFILPPVICFKNSLANLRVHGGHQAGQLRAQGSRRRPGLGSLVPPKGLLWHVGNELGHEIVGRPPLLEHSR